MIVNLYTNPSSRNFFFIVIQSSTFHFYFIKSMEVFNCNIVIPIDLGVMVLQFTP